MKAQDLNYKKTQLTEGVIDRLRYIVDNNDARRVQFDNGEVLTVDLFTASAIVALYNAVSEENKNKIEDKIGQSKQAFYKIADFAFSNVKENTQTGRGDILVNDSTETIKMTESAYAAKPKSSKLTIKDQPYILINKPGIGETAYSVEFTKKHPVLEQKEFEEGTRIHAGVGKKGGAGISGVVMKEENGYVFFRSDEGKNCKAPKEKVVPVSDIKFNEGKDVPSKHQEKIAKDTVKNPDKALLGGPSVEEAEKMLKDKFGYTDAQITKLKKTANEGKHSKSRAQQAAIAISKKEKKESINEKSVSKDQQQAAGAALAAKKGETPVSELQGASKEMYDSMTKKELEDFAGTKHAGLPEKVNEAKDYKAEKNSDGRYTIWTVGETGSRQDVVKDGLTKAQAKKMIDKLYSKDMGLIDEDSIDENAFNQAAASAAKAGKKEFEFDGETYPVEMDKETAKEILEDSENVDIEQWIKQYKKREDNNMHSENVVELARLVGDDKHVEVAQKILDRVGNTGYIEPKVAKAQYNLHRILWNRLLEQYGDVYYEVELDESVHIDDEEGWTDKAVQDPGDYGPLAGAEMAKTQLHYIIYAVDRIKECMREGVHLPNWLQNKISSIHYDMQGIHSYMEGSRLKGQFGRQISEGYHVGSDYGPEAATNMARTQLGFIKYAAQDIINCTDEGTAIPEWYQNKIARLHRGMETVFSYMQGKRHSDVDGDTEKTMDMATPASKPAPATGAAFFGGDDEEYIPEEKSKQKRRKKISESVQSDWDIDKRVQAALDSPFTDPAESSEDVKRRLLSNRKKAEKKITQKVFVPINGALFALSDMLVHPRGKRAIADAYFGEKEREFLKEIKEEIQSIHDKIEGSSVIDPD